jgi:hypothetical protein
MRFVRLVGCLLLLTLQLDAATPETSVTYDPGAGRFGDKLICYLHAKWISYKYGLPLLYKPFPYSDQLALHKIEKRWSKRREDRFKHTQRLRSNEKLRYNRKNTLYIIPYFPEAANEREPPSVFAYFPVDWKDAGFRSLIRKMLKPRYVVPQIQLPKDRISVAVHVRHGGGFDNDRTRRRFPLKLPPEQFYAEQIGHLYEILGQSPLYVHIFTDYRRPAAIMKRLRSVHRDKDIVWNCRRDSNSEKLNVIQDFFEMTRFDCLIRPESNYSIVASKIADYRVMIKPTRFKRAGGLIEITEAEVEHASGTITTYSK